MKLVIFIVVFALFASIQAQVDSQEDDDLLSDYWSNEFDYDEYAENNQAIADINENLEENFDVINKEFDAKISELKENPDVEPNLDSKYDSFLDYQVEDNRLSINDKDAIKVNIDDEPDKEPIPDDAPENIRDDSAILPLKLADDDDDDAWEDIIENIIQDISMSELENPSLEKSQETANDEDNFDENLNDQISSDEFPEIQSVEKTDVNEILDDKPLSEEVPASQLAEVADSDQPKRDEDLNELPDNTLPKLMGQSDLDQIIEETSKLLLESDDNFKADDYDFEEKRSEFFDKDHNDEIADDVLSDLNDDLDKLLETLDKLSDNNSDLGNVDDNMEAVDDFDNIKDYEEKFDRPYREGYILSLRDDLDKSDHSNLPDIFAANAKNDTGEDNESANKTSVEIEVTVDDKKNQVDSAKLAEEELTDNKDEELDEFDYSEIDKLLTYLDNNSDSKEDNGSDLKHPYGNDGLENDQQPLNEDAEIMSTTEADLITETTTEIASKIKDKIILQNATKPENQPTQQKMVDELSSSEYTDLMSQFAIAHSEDLDMRSEDFGKNVAPIHITLSVDKPTIITSPGHPDFYPTNNIIDWIIEGPGIGIEMNVTDLDINGVLGDYLLVKPGGMDESGTDGLIFSFRLNTERRYRFTNVNRMFVRFEAKPGIAFCTGFSFSARMIWPLPEIVTEEIPEPEPVLNPPEETLVLNLSGLTLQQFEDVSPKFKNLIADMAQEYIKDNEIDPGQNTTLEVTQITRLAICNIRWPNYETCVEVTFGVPLHYAQDNETPRLSTEDLDTMWRTYMEKDQYASRLKEIGITEYSMPNDKTVLMVWLVIAGGVVISMAMLAFALWRFSCFEDYTRMRAFNDTDSVQNEKRNLDLYPTPHQTLPPLYTENDYKWADDKYNDSTRVDMGGFANKSYIRDNLFEFDSDEDIITPHDRQVTSISPRDVYEV